MRQSPAALRFAIQMGAGLAALALSSAADAQPVRYPAKPVRVIVPFAPGSPIEVPARAVGQRIAETLGQAFVIDNRAGASGLIGTELVAKAPKDGYTMLAMNCAHTANPSFFRKLPYDSLADFTPVIQVELIWMTGVKSARESYGSFLKREGFAVCAQFMASIV